MKKLSFILASLMLCFAVSMSSCSDKKSSDSSNDSSASASGSASASASASDEASASGVDGAINSEADLVAYLNSATEQIASASSVDDLKVVFEEVDVKVNDFRKANPNYTPSEEVMLALSNAENALKNKLNELGVDINALVGGNSDELVEEVNEAYNQAADGVEALEEVSVEEIDF